MNEKAPMPGKNPIRQKFLESASVVHPNIYSIFSAKFRLNDDAAPLRHYFVSLPRDDRSIK